MYTNTELLIRVTLHGWQLRILWLSAAKSHVKEYSKLIWVTNLLQKTQILFSVEERKWVKELMWVRDEIQEVCVILLWMVVWLGSSLFELLTQKTELSWVSYLASSVTQNWIWGSGLLVEIFKARQGENSLHSSGKAFYKILECIYADFWLFIHNVWGQALMLNKKAWLTINIPICPKGVWVEVRALCRLLKFTPNSLWFITTENTVPHSPLEAWFPRLQLRPGFAHCILRVVLCWTPKETHFLF